VAEVAFKGDQEILLEGGGFHPYLGTRCQGITRASLLGEETWLGEVQELASAEGEGSLRFCYQCGGRCPEWSDLCGLCCAPVTDPREAAKRNNPDLTKSSPQKGTSEAKLDD